MRKRWALLVALMLFGGSIGYATIIGYGGACTNCSSVVNDPTNGSNDFSSGIFSNLPGTSINTQDFQSMTAGPPASTAGWTAVSGGYQTTFTSALYGVVTLTVTGVFATYGVEDTNAGPMDSSDISPGSPGQGQNPTTVNGNPNQFLGPNVRVLNGMSTAGSVTFSFTKPIYAIGLMTIDLNNASGVNPDTLTATIGGQQVTVTPAQLNFGSPATAGCPTCTTNSLYFMGLLSTTSFTSVTFTTVNANSNFPDFVALDNFQFTGSTLPEPGSLALVFGGLALLALRFRKRATR